MNLFQEKDINESNNASSEELKLMSKEGKLLQEDDLEPIIGLKRQVNFEKLIFFLYYFSTGQNMP
jgi:hypothetical protein